MEATRKVSTCNLIIICERNADAISELISNTFPVLIGVPPACTLSFSAGRQVYADRSIDRNGLPQETSSSTKDPAPQRCSTQSTATNNIPSSKPAAKSKVTTTPPKQPEFHLQSSSRRAIEQQKGLENTPEASSPDVGQSRPRKRLLIESEDEITEVPSRGKKPAYASLYQSDSDVEVISDSKKPEAKRVTRGITRG